MRVLGSQRTVPVSRGDSVAIGLSNQESNLPYQQDLFNNERSRAGITPDPTQAQLQPIETPVYQEKLPYASPDVHQQINLSSHSKKDELRFNIKITDLSDL